ncbi:MAG: hypothetical protein WD071_10490 [Pseudohongiella sp.]|uniref:hypothetical protein n=1 Tax=Pseudohongiella sp. TaxID=1979412 RepID=UPI0034A08472
MPGIRLAGADEPARRVARKPARKPAHKHKSRFVMRVIITDHLTVLHNRLTKALATVKIRSNIFQFRDFTSS